MGKSNRVLKDWTYTMKEAVLALELMDLSQESKDRVWEFRKEDCVQSQGSFSLLHSKDEFDSSFRWRYFSGSHLLPPVFITVAGEKIGYVRFRPSHIRHTYEISILISSQHQGKGLGKKALRLAEDYACRQGVMHLFAYIKKENHRSKKLFESEGYICEGEVLPFQYQDTLKPYSSKEELCFLFSKELSQIKRVPQQVFIIAEIGSNWIVGSRKKNREMAKKLVEVAKDSGCDAVKFQVYKAHETYAKGSGKSSYLMKSGIDQEIETLLQEHEVDFDDIAYLYDTSLDLGLEFMASSFSESTFKAIDPYVRRHKIASYEISDPVLLDLVAASKKPIILSTGASTLSHIGWALGRLRKAGAHEDITLLQCTASYPAPEDESNIAVLETLQACFGVKVGLSDHSKDPCIAPILAIGRGATVIEKHITISKALPGPDHAFALEPNELQLMVSACRTAEKMIGDGQKNIQPSENELYSFAQRGLQTTCEVNTGEILRLGENMLFLRPGSQKKGAHPYFLSEIEGKKAKHHLAIGNGVMPEDVE